MMTTTVIAEVGINHNGSLDLALKLIDAAKAAGADYVKFQKREPRLAVPEDQWYLTRQTPWGSMPYIEYKERMEFGQSEYETIAGHCKKAGIGWFASVWDEPSVAFMEQFDPPYVKIPSAKLTDLNLLNAVLGSDVILSTGMSTWQDIERAVGVVGPCVLLHSVSTYPCPNDELNLRAIRGMQALYPKCRIGYSGHERGLIPTVAAVAMGAEVIERHITLDRAMWGTDQAASVEPEGFRRLVRYVHQVEKALGDGHKRIMPSEEPALAKLRGAST